MHIKEKIQETKTKIDINRNNNDKPTYPIIAERHKSESKYHERSSKRMDSVTNDNSKDNSNIIQTNEAVYRLYVVINNLSSCFEKEDII